MNDLKQVLYEYRNEIEEYMKLIEAISLASNNGSPLLYMGENNNSFTINGTLVKIIYANTYLLLYNYIESTITKLLNLLSEKIISENKKISEFNECIRREWLKYILDANNLELTPQKRVKKALNIVSHFVNGEFYDFKITKVGGGNLHDEMIHKITKKLGIKLELSKEVKEKLFMINGRIYRSEGRESCIKEITRLRNKLAHGEQSFSECGKDILPEHLKELIMFIFAYIDNVIDSFEKYIDNHEYLSTCLIKD